MRILHIISSPSIGGVEIYVKDLAAEMTARGHSLHIGFLERAEDIGSSVPFQERYLGELSSTGIEYFLIGHSARRWPWLGIARVRNYVREHQIDIYHAHLTYGAVFGAFVGVPRVYTHHSVAMRVSGFLFALISPLIDQLVGISELCSRALSENTGRDVATIVNGVKRENVLQAQVVPRQLQDSVNCISVGRVCVEKNYEMLVGAIALLSPDIRSRLVVRIAGSGLKKDIRKLNAKITEHGLDETIQLLGGRNDVPELLASSQLFLMSSSSEGLPIALLEAATAGLPCVVTDVGGCGEIINHCRNGIAVRPGDESAFAEAITRIVEHPKMLSEYSKNGLRHSSVYSIDRACTRHLVLYECLLHPTESTS